MQPSNGGARFAPEQEARPALYGAVEAGSAPASPGEASKKRDKTWEFRGTILGLLLDIGGSSGNQLVLLVTLVMSVQTLDTRLLPCVVEPDTGLESFWGACVCEYTKAYLLGFPAVALSLWLLLLGRDLLAKRLYYKLLKRGGVLAFAWGSPWKDPMVAIFIVCYLHCLWHMGLKYFLLVRLHIMIDHTEIAARLHLTDYENDMSTFAWLLSSMLVPCTLLVVFFYIRYNIELSLLPLSQYLLDDSAKDTGDVRVSLRCLRDTEAKHLLEEDTETRLLMRGAGGAAALAGDDIDKRCAALIGASAGASRWADSGDNARTKSFVGLMGSLWPARLLVRSDTSAPARSFRWIWMAYASVALAWLLVALGYLARIVVQDTRGVVHERQWHKGFSICVVAGHVALVCYTIKVFVAALVLTFTKSAS